MSDVEFNRLVEKQKEYKRNGTFFDYKDFILLFDELFDRHLKSNEN